MRYKMRILVLFFGIMSPTAMFASPENTDTLATDTLKCRMPKNPYSFRPTQLIIPGAMIGAGFIGLVSDWVKYTNSETRDELQEHPHSKLGVDDFSQYAPLAATYGLRLCGVKGLHDYIDLTIISGTAYLLAGLSVYGVKTLTKVERPDGSTRNSFPSGHTATAFAGAEILRREYWNVSPWIGVAGYAVAAATGFLRMYNNRHWLTDVAAGAGFGILCAQAAYWLYPLITKTFFHKRYKANIYLSPHVSKESKGLAFQLTF
jgi:membrane-associated phospholipid phosphatase